MPSVTEKLDADESVVPPVVSLIRPPTACAGTIVVTFVGDTTRQNAAIPANVIEQGELNDVPVSDTTVPTGPELGENDVRVGAMRRGCAVAPT
jgi:hypothetical protein